MSPDVRKRRVGVGWLVLDRNPIVADKEAVSGSDERVISPAKPECAAVGVEVRNLSVPAVNALAVLAFEECLHG
jgi:hypothetical protein